MVFKSRAACQGELDPNIWTQGRPKKEKDYTNRELRQREFLSLARKIKPHVALAIAEAVKILNNKEAADSNKLKAATIILDQYKSLVKDIYDDDAEGASEEIQQQNAPVFSLKVIRKDDDVTDVEPKGG